MYRLISFRFLDYVAICLSFKEVGNSKKSEQSKL